MPPKTTKHTETYALREPLQKAKDEIASVMHKAENLALQMQSPYIMPTPEFIKDVQNLHRRNVEAAEKATLELKNERPKLLKDFQNAMAELDRVQKLVEEKKIAGHPSPPPSDTFQEAKDALRKTLRLPASLPQTPDSKMLVDKFLEATKAKEKADSELETVMRDWKLKDDEIFRVKETLKEKDQILKEKEEELKKKDEEIKKLQQYVISTAPHKSKEFKEVSGQLEMKEWVRMMRPQFERSKQEAEEALALVNRKKR